MCRGDSIRSGESATGVISTALASGRQGQHRSSARSSRAFGFSRSTGSAPLAGAANMTRSDTGERNASAMRAKIAGALATQAHGYSAAARRDSGADQSRGGSYRA